MSLIDLPFIALSFRKLRSEYRAEEKNKAMMAALWQEEWFRDYRHALNMYRRGEGPRPVYPSKAVDDVERKVDEEFKSRDPRYRR